MRRTVNLHIEEASTNTLRAEQEAVHNAMKLAVAQGEREGSIDSINAVIDEGATLKRGTDGKIDIQEKMAWQRRCVIAWRNRIATAPEPNQPAMLAELNAYEAAIASENIDAISAHVHTMFNLWTAYSIEHSKTLISKAFAPFCVSIREDMLISLEAAQQTMRRLEGNPNMLKWEGELDKLRMKIYATPNRAEQMSSDCFDVINDLSTSASNLSSEITSAVWGTVNLPDATKHELASDFSSILTPEALQDLMSAVRPLHIDTTTPEAELYVGHQINFKIANLAQVWGAGVLLKIDFGDDQYLTVSGDELRKNPSLTHVYADAKSFTLAVLAAEAFKPDSMLPVPKALGGGKLSLSISPSPISAARHLANIFFNVRFGLALLIAGLLYFWRYHARKAVFGANAFDYAEAFALGFTVSLAINELPQKLAEFIK